MKEKIHSIALTKNEEDVIEDCLLSALNWSDYIYVYDGLSSDATWDIVKNLAQKDDRIIPWKQDGKVFSEGLRGEVFNHFFKNANPGDWWCQLNVDEYCIDNPREYLSEISYPHHVVWATMVEYQLTWEDVENLDFSKPFADIKNSLKHYTVFPSYEPRFFRHRSRLKWDTTKAWPNHLGLNHPQRFLWKHYPFRSPSQIQLRLDIRRDNRERGFEGWEHAKEESWKEKVRNSADLFHETNKDHFSVSKSDLIAPQESIVRAAIKHLMHKSTLWP
jgi:glycosyltransferase involved in cell wall biosynthesis